ncbi:hypothetical protein HJFPF1_06404 [Paramyrothecium foliicola]|nr:hypothetical protein HJFPF1_06404 [Paramyrothecium foliicola]
MSDRPKQTALAEAASAGEADEMHTGPAWRYRGPQPVIPEPSQIAGSSREWQACCLPASQGDLQGLTYGDTEHVDMVPVALVDLNLMVD